MPFSPSNAGGGKFVGGMDKVFACKIAWVLRSYNHEVLGPSAKRHRGLGAGKGGWIWYVVLDYEWLASLTRGCLCLDPKEPWEILEDALRNVHRVEANADALDTLWRLGGNDAISSLVKGSIAYTFSFDASANPDL